MKEEKCIQSSVVYNFITWEKFTNKHEYLRNDLFWRKETK